MCDDSKTPLQRVIAGLTTSGASGIAKASPGIGVTGLQVFGFPVETWVSVLTCAYLLFMLLGALPKVVEALRYLYRLAVPPNPPIAFNQKPSRDVQSKIDHAKR